MPSGQVLTGFGAKANGSWGDCSNANASNTTIVGLFGPNTGAVGSVTLNFHCDFGKVQLRVAVRETTGWNLHMVEVDSTKGQVSVPMNNGATHASVVRVDNSTATVPDKGANVPVGYEVIVVGK